MNINMEIDLSFFQNFLFSTAKIDLGEYQSKEFLFTLSNSFNIKQVDCNNQITTWTKIEESEKHAWFGTQSQKIRVLFKNEISTVKIVYSGPVLAWLNIITDDVRALSSYSFWYPQFETNGILYDKVNVLGCENYFVVHATYEDDKWIYGGNGYDPYNIIAFKKSALKVISDSYQNIYFIDNKIQKYAELCSQSLIDVLEFYNENLFAKKDISLIDRACISPTIYQSAYKRKALIVSNNLGDCNLNIIWMNAHEMAHEWCGGAQCDSWEDWLNETTAEWASLLYAINCNNMDLFNYILKPKVEHCSSLPAIKTLDGHRPDGVHDKGTVLFYQIYKKYGMEVIRKLIQLFVKLETKTTENYLIKVEEIISPEIALFIEKGIIV